MANGRKSAKTPKGRGTKRPAPRSAPRAPMSNAVVAFLTDKVERLSKRVANMDRADQLVQTRAGVAREKELAEAAWLSAPYALDTCPPPPTPDHESIGPYRVVRCPAFLNTLLDPASTRRVAVFPSPYSNGRAFTMVKDSAVGEATVQLNSSTNPNMNSSGWTNGTSVATTVAWAKSVQSKMGHDLDQERYFFMGGYTLIQVVVPENGCLRVYGGGVDEIPDMFGRRAGPYTLQSTASPSHPQQLRLHQLGFTLSGSSSLLASTPCKMLGEGTHYIYLPHPPTQKSWKNHLFADSDTTTDLIATTQHVPYGQPFWSLAAGGPLVLLENVGGTSVYPIQITSEGWYGGEMDAIEAGIGEGQQGRDSVWSTAHLVGGFMGIGRTLKAAQSESAELCKAFLSNVGSGHIKGAVHAVKSVADKILNFQINTAYAKVADPEDVLRGTFPGLSGLLRRMNQNHDSGYIMETDNAVRSLSVHPDGDGLRAEKEPFAMKLINSMYNSSAVGAARSAGAVGAKYGKKGAKWAWKNKEELVGMAELAARMAS
jgi:hypothetical protein